MYTGLRVKEQSFLSDFNETWIFSTHFRKILKKFHEDLSSGTKWLFAVLRTRLKVVKCGNQANMTFNSEDRECVESNRVTKSTWRLSARPRCTWNAILRPRSVQEKRNSTRTQSDGLLCRTRKNLSAHLFYAPSSLQSNHNLPETQET
jgi:hypothetical protein